MKREFVLVPKELIAGSIEIQDALTWCTDEVMRLDAENQRLRLRVEEYQEKERLTIEGVQTRGTA